MKRNPSFFCSLDSRWPKWFWSQKQVRCKGWRSPKMLLMPKPLKVTGTLTAGVGEPCSRDRVTDRDFSWAPRRQLHFQRGGRWWEKHVRSSRVRAESFSWLGWNGGEKGTSSHLIITQLRLCCQPFLKHPAQGPVLTLSGTMPRKVSGATRLLLGSVPAKPAHWWGLWGATASFQELRTDFLVSAVLSLRLIIVSFLLWASWTCGLTVRKELRWIVPTALTRTVRNASRCARRGAKRGTRHRYP